ncbi:MAG TPA: epoxyqueuosine reductase QueH, partial [Thermodesulfobacteriota bacterium]|nr:epoxyqueuosine reductase QueH [Thermodesulfobacteriota bacterium]
MVETVKKTGSVVPRMLVHMCCGPCSIIPLKQVLTDSYEVIGFFHNPNIHPYTEFKKRLLAVKTLAGYLSIGLVCDEEYRPTAFVKGMKASIPGAPRFPPKLQRC